MTRGAVVSWRVNDRAERDKDIAVLGDDRALDGVGERPVGQRDAGRGGEADRERDDRRERRVVDGDRGADRRPARRAGSQVKTRSAALTVAKLTGWLKVTVIEAGRGRQDLRRRSGSSS